MSTKNLIHGSTTTFSNFLQIGCTLRFLPYKWNSASNSLVNTNGTNRRIFNFQKNLHLYYTSFMWIRFIHCLLLREFSLVGALWCLALSSACLSYITMSLFTEELMHFSNRLLSNSLLGTSNMGKQSFKN